MRSLLTCFLFAANLWAIGGPHYVETSPRPGAFALVETALPQPSGATPPIGQAYKRRSIAVVRNCAARLGEEK